MTKKKTLVSESVIRRWGKLADMPALTENWLDTISEEEELEEAEEEMEMKMDDEPGSEAPAEMEMDAEASPEEEQAVERIVSAVVDAISDETGVDIEVEGEAGEDGLEADAPAEPAAEEDAEMDMEDPAGRDRAPAMRNHAAMNRKDEDLNIDVIDDEELTEAVLKRVVERLLRKQ